MTFRISGVSVSRRDLDVPIPGAEVLECSYSLIMVTLILARAAQNGCWLLTRVCCRFLFFVLEMRSVFS